MTVPESVKVLTVYECPKHGPQAVVGGQLQCSAQGGSIACSSDLQFVPYVPQAELDRLRAVGEELYEAVWALDLSDDYTLQEADPGELVRCSRPVNHWIDLVEALKSYREAVPEQLRRADDGDASEQMEGGP